MNISVQREHCAARSLQASVLVVAAALAGCGGGGSSSHASSIPGGVQLVALLPA